MTGILRVLLCGAAAALPAAAPAAAQSFFEGKTITVVTSTGAGGTYDVTARVVARHMPRYIPGRPSMVVQNMPGGGNVIATNHMYTIAPKDGTAMATVHAAMPLHQVLDGRGVRFDASKFNWLGSTGPENEVILVWANVGITDIKQAMEREVVLGGTGTGSGIVIIPAAMNAVLGTKFKMVMGYQTSEDVNLALQRGEVQARAFGLGSILSQRPDWVHEKKVHFIAQAGAHRDLHLPDVPLLTELAANEEQRRVMKLISSPPGLGHPYLVPPGVPEDRVALLRDAFAKTLRDKEFLAEAEKLRLDIEPMSAEEVTQLVADTIGAPAETVAKAKAAIESPQPGGPKN